MARFNIQQAFDSLKEAVTAGFNEAARQIKALDQKVKKSEQAVTDLQASKADVSHTHTVSEVTGLSAELERYALKTELQNINIDTSDLATKASVDDLSEQITTKAERSHSHVIDDIANLQTELDSKASNNHRHTIAQVSGLSQALDGKADTAVMTRELAVKANKDELASYALKTELQNINIDTSDLATKASVETISAQLSNKADNTHSHAWSDITDKPSSFTPSLHTHRASDISDLQTILSKYATKDEIPQINTDDLTIDTSNLATTTALSELETAMRNFLNTKADRGIRLTAGSGLSGGGNLTSHRTISLGTPSTITASSTNAVTDTSHSHQIASASTSTAGIVQLNDSLSSDSNTQALTAKQGKMLNDTKADKTHQHSVSDISGLNEILSEYATKDEITSTASSNTDIQVIESSERDISLGVISAKLTGRTIIFPNRVIRQEFNFQIDRMRFMSSMNKLNLSFWIPFPNKVLYWEIEPYDYQFSDYFSKIFNNQVNKMKITNSNLEAYMEGSVDNSFNDRVIGHGKIVIVGH